MRDLPERLLNDLNDAASSMGGIRIERLFTTEPDRLDQLTVEAAGIALDLATDAETRFSGGRLELTLEGFEGRFYRIP